LSSETLGFYQGQGHKEGLYNQNMMVSTISCISSNESFATKLDLMTDHHKQKTKQQKQQNKTNCPLKVLDCCVQGQCYSQG